MATSGCSHGNDLKYKCICQTTLSKPFHLQLNIVWVLPHFSRIATHDVSWAWKIAACFIPVSFVSAQYLSGLGLTLLISFTDIGMGGWRCISRSLHSSFLGWRRLWWMISLFRRGRDAKKMFSSGHSHISSLGAVMVSSICSKLMSGILICRYWSRPSCTRLISSLTLSSAHF